jgi:hypothetical protein
MTQQQTEICERMYAALKSVGCRCEHNVPYAGCAEPQFVKQKCARCSCIEDYEEMLKEPQA